MEVFCGTLVHSTEDDPFQILQGNFIGVDDGKIAFVEKSLEEVQEKFPISKSDIQYLSNSEFLMPGMVDSHIHAPQYAFCGTNVGLPLLEWLNKYTFPIESKFKDTSLAKDVYNKVAKRILKAGTTTASYFATTHLESTVLLCNEIELSGQRAHVGKVNMDANCPDYYIEDTKQSLNDTASFIEHTLNRKNPLLTPAITPRFAPSCSRQLLFGLAELFKQYNIPIQTHVSENQGEIAWIRELFPESKHYTDVYNTHGLLTNKTLLAHGVYLSDDELELIKSKGSSVAHCPNSNLSLCSGIFDARRAVDFGVKVGLGTDVGGGYSPSILNAQRLAVHSSNAVSFNKRDSSNYKEVDFKEAFMLGTLGGSKALGLDHKIGNFEVGKEFDALRINATVPRSPFDLFNHDREEDIISKFLHLGDDRNITEIFVAGLRV